jgi:hypothetical protein
MMSSTYSDSPTACGDRVRIGSASTFRASHLGDREDPMLARACGALKVLANVPAARPAVAGGYRPSPNPTDQPPPGHATSSR